VALRQILDFMLACGRAVFQGVPSPSPFREPEKWLWLFSRENTRRVYRD